MCDGVDNCPRGSLSSDEDKKMCRTHKNVWENFADNIIKKFQPPHLLNIKWLHEKALETLNDTQLSDLKTDYDDLLRTSEQS